MMPDGCCHWEESLVLSGEEVEVCLASPGLPLLSFAGNVAAVGCQVLGDRWTGLSEPPVEEDRQMTTESHVGVSR